MPTEMEDRIIDGVTVFLAEKHSEVVIFGSTPRVSEDKLLDMVAQETSGKPARRVHLTAWPNPDPEVYGWSRGNRDYSSQSSHSSGGRYCAPWSTEGD